MSAPVEIHIVWDGTHLTITYRKQRFHKDFDHIELHVDEGFILPVTKTGYRSHFLPAATVEEFGGPEGYVRAWLDHEAQSPDWKRRKDAARQMSLF